MGPRAALEAVQLIRPRVVIPIHWGSLVPFGLHLHTWSYLTQPPLEFVALSRRERPTSASRCSSPEKQPRSEPWPLSRDTVPLRQLTGCSSARLSNS